MIALISEPHALLYLREDYINVVHVYIETARATLAMFGLPALSTCAELMPILSQLVWFRVKGAWKGQSCSRNNNALPGMHAAEWLVERHGAHACFKEVDE